MQYMVGSGRILTSKTLKPYLLHVGMKKVQSKEKTLECFDFRPSNAGNSVVSGPIC